MNMNARALALSVGVDERNAGPFVDELVARELGRRGQADDSPDAVGVVERVEVLAAWIDGLSPGVVDREAWSDLREELAMANAMLDDLRSELDAAHRQATEQTLRLEAVEAFRVAAADDVERLRGKLRLVVGKLDEAAEAAAAGQADAYRRKLSEARNIAERAASRLPERAGGE